MHRFLDGGLSGAVSAWFSGFVLGWFWASDGGFLGCDYWFVLGNILGRVIESVCDRAGGPGM